MDRAKGARPDGESLAKRSGMLPRHRDAPAGGADSGASPTDVSQSQLRRRWEVDVELDIARATRAASAPGTREPGFLEDEPEDGVPTPRPRMPLGSIPLRVVADHQLLTLPLDHREGFVLSHIDGETDIRTLIDVCGMTHDELVAVVDRLVALRVIRLS